MNPTRSLFAILQVLPFLAGSVALLGSASPAAAEIRETATVVHTTSTPIELELTLPPCRERYTAFVHRRVD